MLSLDKKTEHIVVKYLPTQDVLERLSCFFALFSDTTRLKIISALSISEMCVTDLGHVLSINQSTLSHQLKSLKNMGVISSKRSGKNVYYSTSLEVVNKIMCSGVEFISG